MGVLEIVFEDGQKVPRVAEDYLDQDALDTWLRKVCQSLRNKRILTFPVRWT